MSRSTEIWKDIPNYEGLYQASNYGNIKRLHKDYRCKPYKVLKPQKSGNYYTVTLSKNGICTPYTVHYLIAKTFISNPENKSQVNHKDGNKLNNLTDNLEWVTSSENMIHAYNTGLMKNAIISTKNRLSKPVSQFTKDGEFVKSYKSVADASNITGIHYSSICRSCKTHLLAGGYKWKYKNGGD